MIGTGCSGMIGGSCALWVGELQEALFTIQPASTDYPSADSGSAADRRVGSLRPTKQPDHRRPRSGDPSGQRAASRAPTRRTAMARSYGGARSSSSAGIGGTGVIAARAVMDQRSEGAGRSVERYQLALPEPGVAAPALHLGARVNASPLQDTLTGSGGGVALTPETATDFATATWPTRLHMPPRRLLGRERRHP
jgi:hypothetical protein